MKTLKKLTVLAGLLTALFILFSCEQKIAVESDVEPDGSVTRRITFTEVDSVRATHNMFDINAAKGWETSVEPFGKKVDTTREKSEPKFTITFKKNFPSVAEANDAMDSNSDTVFRIHSSFERKFRWFYTYIEYSDTYRAINRFRHLPAKDYFTDEDYAFIDRLPAEGRQISKADSIYMDQLTEKTFGHYALAAFYTEHFNAMVSVAEKTLNDKKWVDTLKRYEGRMLSTLQHASDDSDIFNKPIMIPLLDSLRIGFPLREVESAYLHASGEIETRMNFMKEVTGEAQFSHVIRMPWTVVDTNADSVQGNELHWRPPLLRFSLSDYTMTAKARKLNWWAVAVSGIIVIISLYIIFHRKPAM